MRRSRFSIAGLMGLVLVIALGLVGLKQANPVWASTFFSVTLVLLVIGVLNAIQSRARARAFWVGFAITGWAYFLCVFGHGSASMVGSPPLLTGLLLDRSQPLLHPDAGDSISFTMTPATGTTAQVAGFTPAITLPQPTRSNITLTQPSAPVTTWMPWNITYDTITIPYRQVGHSMAALLLAYLGGLYSLFAASRRDGQHDESASNASPSFP